MPLVSKLFRGDKKLQAAQVSDPAHILQGAQGPHVAKIQFALFALDSLVIDRAEIKQQRYAASTAGAVLAYKRKRKIINPAYQTAADDIVGKMTITRLDADMALWEATHPAIDDCTLSPPGVPGGGVVRSLSAAPVSTRLSAQGIRAGKSDKPQFGRVLSVVCIATKRAVVQDGFPIRAQIEIAKEILFEFGLTLSVEFNRTGFADLIDFGRLEETPLADEMDKHVGELRQAAEDVRPGFPKILRIIVAQRSVNGNPGETFRNIRVGTNSFPPFVVLNSLNPVRDNSTFLHEMIHAANLRPIPHDPEEFSVFFKHAHNALGDVDRRMLKVEHARTMSQCFFSV